MKQFRRQFSCDPHGRLMLFGRQVHGAVNDRFILNTLMDYERLDLASFAGFNRCFVAGADKSVAYALYDEFFGAAAADEQDACPGAGTNGLRFPSMAPRIHFQRCDTRDELVLAVHSWLHGAGRLPVIKPNGTGCGDGIEFFLDTNMVSAASCLVASCAQSICFMAFAK